MLASSGTKLIFRVSPACTIGKIGQRSHSFSSWAAVHNRFFVHAKVPQRGSCFNHQRPSTIRTWQFEEARIERGFSSATNVAGNKPASGEEPSPTMAPNPFEPTAMEAKKEEVGGMTKFQQLKAMIKSSMLVLKTGTKELLSNVKESNKIRQKMKEHGEESLTRQEARLVAKVQKDIKKLFPFALLFMVLPEAIPFAVILKPDFLPSVYKNIVPQQKLKLKHAKKNLEALRDMKNALHNAIPDKKESIDVDAIMKQLLSSPEKENHVDDSGAFWRSLLTINNLPEPLLHAMCRYMSIHSRFAPTWYLRTSLEKTLAGLQSDDKWLVRAGGVEQITDEEVEEACDERRIGAYSILQEKEMKEVTTFDAQTSSFQTKREHLSAWVRASTDEQAKVPPPALLLWSLKYDYHNYLNNNNNMTSSSSVGNI